MKRIRKLCIIFVMCILCVMLCSCGDIGDENAAPKIGNKTGEEVTRSMIERGKTEDGVIYEYNKENATLTVSGKNVRGGYPDNYSKKIHGDPEKRPWEKWRDDTKKIVLEEGVESVTNMAFTNFTNTEEIVFPATLKQIGIYAFYGSTREIKRLTLPDSVEEIGWCAFAQNSHYKGIEVIKLPRKLHSIGELAFSNQSFESITIPENVESIGDEAFEGCSQLEKVTVKSKKLKKAGSCFLHTNEDLAIYVPKELEKEYREILGQTDGHVYPMKG